MRTRLPCWILVPLLACVGDPAPSQPAPVPEAWAHDTDSAFFLQMSDTQFGMYSKPVLFSYLGWSFREGSFARETENMEKAIAHANRLRPDFVVICGDLVNTAAPRWNPPGSSDASKVAAISRISPANRHALKALSRAAAVLRAPSPGWESDHSFSNAPSTPSASANARMAVSSAAEPLVQAA